MRTSERMGRFFWWGVLPLLKVWGGKKNGWRLKTGKWMRIWERMGRLFGEGYVSVQQAKKSRCVWVAVGWVVRLSWIGRQVWLGNVGRKKREIVRSRNFNLKMYLSIFLSNLFIYLSIYLSIFLSNLSIFLSINLSICLSIYLSFYLSV